MTSLLFPGRHHLLTRFQHDCLRQILTTPPAGLRDVDGAPLEGFDPVDTVLWAVTSADHANTRRNPLPANRREVAIEDFARDLPGRSLVYLIDDLGRSPRFAEYVLKKIAVESNGRFRLAPEDTLVGCSTPEVLALYRALGFRVLPFELESLSPERYRARRPWQLVEGIAEAARAGRDFRAEPALVAEVHPASLALFAKYELPAHLGQLFDDPLLGQDGDLTDTRDYATYIGAFDRGAARKYAEIREHVRPGRIVDIGCCTGALLREMTLDERLRESDFYGIEAAQALYQECVHRKEQGLFANDHVFFFQRNFSLRPIFSPHSVDTFTTLSLTHEIVSYQGRSALDGFLGLLRGQLVLGGRWLNLDVVGPDERELPVLMELEAEDGSNQEPLRAFDGLGPKEARAALERHLEGLSTRARFERFAADFRAAEGERLVFERVREGGRELIALRLEDACEFLSKKNYTDNWQSEMHERFCFFSFAEWRRAAEEAGFRVLPASRAFQNPWIVEHWWRPCARLYRRRGRGLEELAYPVTNLLLVCENR